MSRRRRVILALLTLLLLPLLVLGLMVARFDPNQYAPAIVSAVDQATGRQLVLHGPIVVRFSLTPVIVASNIVLSEPVGFSDPYFLRLDRVEARVALLPLLSRHIDILQLLLVGPAVHLERNQAGQANWDFELGRLPGAGSQAAPSPRPDSGLNVALQAVKIEDGELDLADGSGRAPVVLKIPEFDGSADTLDSPLRVNGQAELGTAPVNLSGVLGPIAQFSGAGMGPWPIDLQITLGRASASMTGEIAHPRNASGYNVAVKLNIPRLEDMQEALTGFLAGVSLPPLRDIQAAAQIVDQGSALPAINDLKIHVGASDLSALRPGLVLQSAQAGMAAEDAPVTFSLAGQTEREALKVSGTLGPLDSLLNPDLLPAGAAVPGSYPVNVSVQLGTALAAVTGAVATPRTLSGVALALSATVPDLSSFSVLTGEKLPTWKHIILQTTIIDPGGAGLRNAAGVDDLTVKMDDASFGGAASLFFGNEPRLQAALAFSSIDLDALLAGIPVESVAAPSPPPRQFPDPDSAGSKHVIPNWELPVDQMRHASADIQISADTVRWNRATYSALQGHAVLANGVLTLDPLTGQIPGGNVRASATFDTTKTPAAGSVKISAPALALAPFLEVFGLSGIAEGTLQAQLAATATGDDVREMAGSVDGELGLATVNGVVDGSVMQQLFGSVLSAVGLPAKLVGKQGPVPVRCMGFRMDAANGIGTIRALTLDSSRLLLQGGGTVNFGTEALGIVLRPRLDLAGTDLGVPVEIGGTFFAPTTQVAPVSALQAAARSAIALPVGLAQDVTGRNPILGKAANVLGIAENEDICPAALALARMGQAGPAAPPPGRRSELPYQSSIILSAPKSLLNALFGK